MCICIEYIGFGPNNALPGLKTGKVVLHSIFPPSSLTMTSFMALHFYSQVEDGGLPRVQRTFQQIAQRAEQLSNRLRVGVEDTHTATLLLAREGIDPTALMQEVRSIGAKHASMDLT